MSETSIPGNNMSDYRPERAIKRLHAAAFHLRLISYGLQKAPANEQKKLLSRCNLQLVARLVLATKKCLFLQGELSALLKWLDSPRIDCFCRLDISCGRDRFVYAISRLSRSTSKRSVGCNYLSYAKVRTFFSS